MKVQVECYSGGKADERPIRFMLGERRHLVEEVLDRWYGPNDTFFKVRSDDGNIYVLQKSHVSPEGSWSLASFRLVRT